ncbi:unnamed protein product [Gongylonema pulchrum]|uniref:C2H2-type domain-containing protein n=1 Tax=Gongylonema pulchrum TaxID=637853 RepID=A0A183EUP7_9BILA|nr:unnamed protein product [Gongylonema pulchrum]
MRIQLDEFAEKPEVPEQLKLQEQVLQLITPRQSVESTFDWYFLEKANEKEELERQGFQTGQQEGPQKRAPPLSSLISHPDSVWEILQTGQLRQQRNPAPQILAGQQFFSESVQPSRPPGQLQRSPPTDQRQQPAPPEFCQQQPQDLTHLPSVNQHLLQALFQWQEPQHLTHLPLFNQNPLHALSQSFLSLGPIPLFLDCLLPFLGSTSQLPLSVQPSLPLVPVASAASGQYSSLEPIQQLARLVESVQPQNVGFNVPRGPRQSHLPSFNQESLQRLFQSHLPRGPSLSFLYSQLPCLGSISQRSQLTQQPQPQGSTASAVSDQYRSFLLNLAEFIQSLEQQNRDSSAPRGPQQQ